MRKVNTKFLVTLSILFFSIFYAIPALFPNHKFLSKFYDTKSIRLGLDLQGGTQLLLKVETEAALNEIANLAYRVREIGIQADNAALLSSTMEVAALNAEVAAIYDTINNIHDEVKFNEKALNGEGEKTFSIGSSIDGTNNNTIQTNDTMETGIETFTTAADAEASADKILTDVAIGLGHVAAGISSLKGRQAVSYASAANLEAAASRILDTDYARETANLTKNSVLNQSAMAMVAQANQAQSAILAVLQ